MFALTRSSSQEQLFKQPCLDQLRQKGIRLQDNQVKICQQAIAKLFESHPNGIDFAILDQSEQIPYPLIVIKNMVFLVKVISTPNPLRPHSRVVPQMAFSLTTGECYFLKVLTPKNENDADPVRMATREYNHCQVIGLTVHLGMCYGDTGVTCYLLLPFYPGKDVQELLDMEGLTVKQALFIGHYLCVSLGEWHQKGLLHLDIKPANIMFDEKTGHVNITDFETALKTGTVINQKDKDADGELEEPVCFGTQGYLHPRLMEDLAHEREVKCIEGHDVYAVIQTLLRLLDYALNHERKSSQLTAIMYTKSYLNAQLHVTQNDRTVVRGASEMPSLSSLQAMMTRLKVAYDGHGAMNMLTHASGSGYESPPLHQQIHLPSTGSLRHRVLTVTVPDSLCQSSCEDAKRREGLLRLSLSPVRLQSVGSPERSPKSVL
jgi:serine/threonine protein kinase